MFQNSICKAEGGGNKMLKDIGGVDIEKWLFGV